MSDNYEYFRNKRLDHVYLSSSQSEKQYKKGEDGNVEELERPFRIVSKVVDCAEAHQFFRDGKQVSLRITGGGRQEIKAKFYEDNRGISTLHIQRYTIESGSPHKVSFSFNNSEISVLYNFLRNIPFLTLKDGQKARLDDRFVESLALTREQTLELLNQQPDLLDEILKSRITASDVAELSHRKEQLQEFGMLLFDADHFARRRQEMFSGQGGAEAVWQEFFERNTWIFGYGLNYVFNTALDDTKLEQVVRGHDIAGAGKRVDALLKTHGLISALSFGEIKTHMSPLLKQVEVPYRKECWQISAELAGGIAQVQRSVQVSLSSIRSRLDVKDAKGAPTGESVFLYQPRSFLVIGSLTEFQSARGINEEKYSSFELFRRNTKAPEIITFDELYERARFIVKAGEDRTETSDFSLEQMAYQSA